MINEYFPPRISADTEVFWNGCKEHKLLVQQCIDCGEVRWPAAYLCPHCLSENVRMVQLKEQGVIYSFTVLCRPFHLSLAEKLPYVVAAVDIGRVRLISNIVNCDPKEVQCGDQVRLLWADGVNYTRPVFELLHQNS